MFRPEISRRSAATDEKDPGDNTHRRYLERTKPYEFEEDKVITYLPATFEGMMEQFGVNLQRRNLYNELYSIMNDYQ